jgi:hypothetical protein
MYHPWNVTGIHMRIRRGYSGGMSTIDPTMPGPRRFSIRLPRPLWIGVAAVLLVVAEAGLRIGVPIYRQHAAVREVKRLGGKVEAERHGPEWLAARTVCVSRATGRSRAGDASETWDGHRPVNHSHKNIRGRMSQTGREKEQRYGVDTIDSRMGPLPSAAGRAVYRRSVLRGGRNRRSH